MDNDGLEKMNLSGKGNKPKFSTATKIYGVAILGFALYGMAQFLIWLTEHLTVH